MSQPTNAEVWPVFHEPGARPCLCTDAHRTPKAWIWNGRVVDHMYCHTHHFWWYETPPPEKPACTR